MTPVERWKAMPPIFTLMPVVLGNGQRVDRILMRCATCETAYDQLHMRGDLAHRPGGSFSVRAVCICFTCRVASYAHMHVAPDVLRGQGHIIHEAAGYPVRVPWPEDTEDYAAFAQGVVPPITAGKWIEIMDRVRSRA